MLHKQASYEENGFLDRWGYLQWRARLAGITVRSDERVVKLQAPGEDEVLFYRLTGFQSAVQWLQSRRVVLPGVEDYPRGQGDWSAE